VGASVRFADSAVGDDLAMGDPPVAVQSEVEDGFVWSAIPVRVITDTAREVALFRARGTRCWWPSHPRNEHPPADTVTQRSESWEHGFAGLLTIVEPGAEHSVSLLWGDDWGFSAWYVDFIRPYRRTPIGWDFADLHLDLVLTNDGPPRVKDEDELEAAVDGGRLTLTEAERVRGKCAELVERIRRGEPLVRPEWLDWRPDPRWWLPSLSADRGQRLSTAPTPSDEDLTLDAWLG
jgi:hypothetical protein